MKKTTINVLFVCGYGVGSSAMSAQLVKRGLDKLHIRAEVDHTAAGEVAGYANWADVIAVSKAFVNNVRSYFDEEIIIEVENIMDGDGIAKKVFGLVAEKYPYAIINEVEKE